jgi:hypothetical protein
VIVTNTLPGLQIDSSLAVPTALNFRPPSWPPPDDFPVCVDAHGSVKARYGDATWDLSPWAGRACSITFEGRHKTAKMLTPANAALLRRVVAWWIWGPYGVQKASTLDTRVRLIKPLFVICSEAGIAADTLSRFPAVIAAVARHLHPSAPEACLSQLHRLWVAREQLGFELLSEQGLATLAQNLPDGYEHTQTAYIPPRIWSYQLLRLRACLEEYMAHRDQVEACYRFCLGEYAHNAGGLLTSAFFKKGTNWLPFAYGEQQYGGPTGARTGRRFHGAFRDTAKRFGIDALLDRWVNGRATIRDLSLYLSLITTAGMAYCLNFSLMRKDEGAQLRSECLRVERDGLGDDIYLLGGVTTKTIEDDQTWWIVPPSATIAIEAMRHVARLRLEAAQHNPRRNITPAQIDNPLLFAATAEPWSGATGGDVRTGLRNYSVFVDDYPKLFDVEQLRITPEDIAIAHQMTFGLDKKVFAVGNVWPLAWHQLRRTGAVNMLSSGIVSESSLQYQLKHLSRGMTRYYGQNWYKLKAQLSSEATGLFLKEKFRALAQEVASLPMNRNLISPHGEMRKEQLIRPISKKDFGGLEKAAKAGKISFRRTIFGGCVKPGPCSYGGISYFTSCAGSGREKPCEDALFDKSPARKQGVKKLRRAIKIRLLDAEAGSSLAESLEASMEATQRYLDATTDNV